MVTDLNRVLKMGNRVEMFIDDYLVGLKKNVTIRMNSPQKREVALFMDKPWEGESSGVYSVVFKDKDIFRMFYRATFPDNIDDRSINQGCAYAESCDGINWERKNAGIFEYKGQDTNIVFTGSNAHNFSPFYDTNPECPDDERYKAIAGHHPEGLAGYKSADCIHWEPVRSKALITKGAFDSQNIVFYDTNYNRYVCYSRYFTDPIGELKENKRIRAIQYNYSDDFINWTEPEPNSYDASMPIEHFYTNSTVLCPGAEHIYLSFPMRFVPDRHKIMEHKHKGVSDNIIMTSRDGRKWDRFLGDSWLRPGLDQRNWTQRNLIAAQGILETGDEFSMYVNENYEWDTSCIRRITIPRHRFGSMYADRFGGVFSTKKFLFEGNRLALNYSTSAPGSIKVGIFDENGWPVAGHTIEECDVIFGDELVKHVSWKNDADLGFLRGRPVSLRFELKEADIYSIQVC